MDVATALVVIQSTVSSRQFPRGVHHGDLEVGTLFLTPGGEAHNISVHEDKDLLWKNEDRRRNRRPLKLVGAPLCCLHGLLWSSAERQALYTFSCEPTGPWTLGAYLTGGTRVAVFTDARSTLADPSAVTH